MLGGGQTPWLLRASSGAKQDVPKSAVKEQSREQQAGDRRRWPEQSLGTEESGQARPSSDPGDPFLSSQGCCPARI